MKTDEIRRKIISNYMTEWNIGSNNWTLDDTGKVNVNCSE